MGGKRNNCSHDETFFLFYSFDLNLEDSCDGIESVEVFTDQDNEEKDPIESLFCGLNLRIPKWLSCFLTGLKRRHHGERAKKSSTTNVFYGGRNWKNSKSYTL